MTTQQRRLREIVVPALTREPASKRLVKQYLAMVDSIAGGYRNAVMHELDLIPQGNDGLLLALKTLEPTPTEVISAHHGSSMRNRYRT